jgi:hypothetical protein
MLENSDWRLGHDFFASEARTLERDVQIIVIGFLEAGPNTRPRVSLERRKVI